MALGINLTQNLLLHIKLYWNTAPPLFMHYYSCFCVSVTELSKCIRGQMAWKVKEIIISLFTKKPAIPILFFFYSYFCLLLFFTHLMGEFILFPPLTWKLHILFLFFLWSFLNSEMNIFVSEIMWCSNWGIINIQQNCPYLKCII